MSRNQLEGKYVGRWRYKHVRRKKEMPAWIIEEEIVLDAHPPFVDASVAWVTFNERNKQASMERMRSCYISKADRALYGF